MKIFDDYFLQDWATIDNQDYLLEINPNGAWLIIRIDNTNNSLRFANQKNNNQISSDEAWANKKTLTYSKLKDII